MKLFIIQIMGRPAYRNAVPEVGFVTNLENDDLREGVVICGDFQEALIVDAYEASMIELKAPGEVINRIEVTSEKSERAYWQRRGATKGAEVEG